MEWGWTSGSLAFDTLVSLPQAEFASVRSADGDRQELLNRMVARLGRTVASWSTLNTGRTEQKNGAGLCSTPLSYAPFPRPS